MSAIVQTPPVSLDAEFNRALGVAGLNTKTARFDPGLLALFRRGEFATPLYTVTSENPWRTPWLMDTIRRELSGYTGRPNDSANTLARLAGFGTRRTLIGNPIQGSLDAASKPGALATVLDRMQHDGSIVGRSPDVKSLPPEVDRAAALLLDVALRVKSYRNLAVANVGDLAPIFAQMSKGYPDDANAVAMEPWLAVYKDFKPEYMAAGGNDILMACQEAAVILEKVSPTAKYEIRFRTIWGVVELSGGKGEDHKDADTFLLIDTGGDDVYEGCPANSSPTNWSSIVIDTDGNDKYLSDDALLTTAVAKWSGRKGGGNLPGPGGALFGYSVLIDSKGDDLYRTHRAGLGSGRFGLGVLLDKAGDDQYDAYQDSQGFGMFGGGILEDDGGRDIYRGFTQVQGVGQTGGFGYLNDRLGEDQYIAEDTVIDFPSPQSAEHNVSMAQGAGNGRRADYLEGFSLAGGIGVLYDASGNDSYSSAVFGQGVGYWMGVGALWDDGGNDTYNGMWYVMGAAAHFAVGYLEDQQGTDTYNASMNMAQGAGHDFSIGVLVDRRGNDVYTAPNLSLGAGNANGIGIFAELSGDDKYGSSGITLGGAAEATAATLRARAICLGVFLDASGSDAYPATAGWAGNGKSAQRWASKAEDPAEGQVGVFVDR